MVERLREVADNVEDELFKPSLTYDAVAERKGFCDLPSLSTTPPHKLERRWRLKPRYRVRPSNRRESLLLTIRYMDNRAGQGAVVRCRSAGRTISRDALENRHAGDPRDEETSVGVPATALYTL